MLIQSALATHSDQLVLLLAGMVLLAALVVAAAGMVLGRRQFELQDARKRLDRAVGALVSIQQGQTSALGDPLAVLGPAAAATRQAAVEHHLANALDALTTKALRVSYFQCVVVATTLVAAGRTGEAQKYFGRACDRAEGRFGRASAQRAFGSALMAAGQLGEGRRHLLAAGKTFLDLSRNNNFDHDELVGQAFDTSRLLIQFELDRQHLANAGSDLRHLCDLACSLRDPSRAAAARRSLAALTAVAERLRNPPAVGSVDEAGDERGEERMPPNPRARKRDLVLVSG